MSRIDKTIVVLLLMMSAIAASLSGDSMAAMSLDPGFTDGTCDGPIPYPIKIVQALAFHLRAPVRTVSSQIFGLPASKTFIREVPIYLLWMAMLL